MDIDVPCTSTTTINLSSYDNSCKLVLIGTLLMSTLAILSKQYLGCACLFIHNDNYQKMLFVISILVYVTWHQHRQDCHSLSLFVEKVEPLHKHHTSAFSISPGDFPTPNKELIINKVFWITTIRTMKAYWVTPLDTAN